MIKGKNKYIRRYPELELVHILKNSGYHSSEWEETDLEDEMDPDEDDHPIEDVVKEKTTSLYVYEKWWRSPAVCIQYSIFILLTSFQK